MSARSPLVRPPALPADGTVGVVASASPGPARYPRRFERGLDELAARGLRVRVGEHARDALGHTAGSIADRVEDIHRHVEDPDVAMIMAAIGGFNSHQLLESLDYELLRARPKLFIGFSDITALLLAIHVRTGLVTVLGPAVMPQFGEFGGVHPYTWRYFRRVTGEGWTGTFDPADGWLPEHLWWDTDDDRPRAEVPNPGPRTLRRGVAEGPIVAANGNTLLALAGTSYWPDLRGAVLLVEEAEDATPETVDRSLFQLRHTGAFDLVAGLGLGRFRPETQFTPDVPMDEIVLRAVEGYDFPVVVDLDFGHTDPMMSLPLGVRARLDAGARPRLALLEPATA